MKNHTTRRANIQAGKSKTGLMLKRIEKTIDMHGATAHVFRRSLGTLLYDASQNVKAVQSIVESTG